MTLKEIVEQLEQCNFECEAGPLVNNAAFIVLKSIANIPSDEIPDADQPPEYCKGFIDAALFFMTALTKIMLGKDE